MWTSAQLAVGTNIDPDPLFFAKSYAREIANTYTEVTSSDAVCQPSRRRMISAMHDSALFSEKLVSRTFKQSCSIQLAIHRTKILSNLLNLPLAHTALSSFDNRMFPIADPEHFGAFAQANCGCQSSHSSDNLGPLSWMIASSWSSNSNHAFDLWHRALGLAIVGIVIAAVCLALNALPGLIRDGRSRRCVPAMRESSAASNSIHRASFCARESQMQNARDDGNFHHMSWLMHGSQMSNCADRLPVFMASAAAPTPLISRQRWTSPNLLKHRIATSARRTACALFASQASVAVVLLLSLLPLTMATDQTCANPLLGIARNDLAAASLPSGLVFFAGGFFVGAQKFVCAWQLRRVVLCCRAVTMTMAACVRCCELMLLRA